MEGRECLHRRTPLDVSLVEEVSVALPAKEVVLDFALLSPQFARVSPQVAWGRKRESGKSWSTKALNLLRLHTEGVRSSGLPDIQLSTQRWDLRGMLVDKLGSGKKGRGRVLMGGAWVGRWGKSARGAAW